MFHLKQAAKLSSACYYNLKFITYGVGAGGGVEGSPDGGTTGGFTGVGNFPLFCLGFLHPREKKSSNPP